MCTQTRARFATYMYETGQSMRPGKLFCFSIDAPQHSYNNTELPKMCSCRLLSLAVQSCMSHMDRRGAYALQSPNPFLFESSADRSAAWCFSGRGAQWYGDSVRQDMGKATIPFHIRQRQIPYAAILFQFRVSTDHRFWLSCTSVQNEWRVNRESRSTCVYTPFVLMQMMMQSERQG